MKLTPASRLRDLLLACGVAALAVGPLLRAELAPATLRCEYLTNPLGIEVTQPRLSWTVESAKRGERQTAYRILVASSEELLAKDEGDWWDSGKVISDQTQQVAYLGEKLGSRARCFWKVSVWDKDGKPSAWSAPGSWTIGLLERSDWSAKWIDAVARVKPYGPQLLPMITLAVYEPVDGVGSLDVTAKLKSMAVSRGFSVDVDNGSLGGDPSYGHAKRLRVEYEIAGRKTVRFFAEKVKMRYPDDLAPPPVITKATYETVDGKTGRDVTRFLTRPAEDGHFSLKIDNEAFGTDPAPNRLKHLRVEFMDNGVSEVKLIAENAVLHYPSDLAPTLPLPYLRREFSVAKPIARATVYATALGVYEMRINGRRVGDHILAPEWTDYSKRLRYQEYDVTQMLAAGRNVIGAQVANGWYSGHIGNGGHQYWGKSPALFAQLEIVYQDGSRERVITDGRWKSHVSPLLATDFMIGEEYDARKEIRDWDKPGFNDSEWMAASERLEIPRQMDGQVMEPVRQLLELRPTALTQPAPGRWTYDIGQNMVGVVRLKVKASAGTRITLRHAEMLNPDGTIYTDNLRGAPSVDHYICKGGGEESWQPKFTFHGFRYVELTGVSEKPSLEAVTGVVIGSDTPRTGDFACSDPRVNQLQSNIEWGQRGNYLSVPTDCPQRDERLGWMGDAQVFVKTATYNADVAAFFTKWLVDVTDSQAVGGRFDDVAPFAGPSQGTPAWGDAGVICPWTIYQAYGDRKLLERQYPAMVKWVEYCKSQSSYSIRSGNRGNDYGDWLSIDADTDKELIGTAYYAYSTRLVAQSAAVLGRTEDAAAFDEQFQEIRRAFIEKYVTPDGHVLGNTQCAYLMALKFDLLPNALRMKAADYLEADIIEKGYHLSTGFVGVSYLLPELTKAGKVDTAYRLLLQDTFPSWLFSVKMGATTIWERWDGWTPDKGFQNVIMNSFNHYSLGSCGEWLFASVAGIAADPSVPGFKKIVIRPLPGSALNEASGEFRSVHGPITSAWSSGSDGFALTTRIPANTTATVHFPAAEVAGVHESGKPATEAEGVKFLRMEDGAAVFEVESGNYQFTSGKTPAAGGDSISRRIGEGLRIPIESLMRNDGQGCVFLAVASWSLRGAEISEQDGSISYQPAPGNNGDDRFTYTIRTAGGGIATRTVHVTVVAGKSTVLAE